VPGEDFRTEARGACRWTVVAFAVFFLAVAATHGAVWREGVRQFVPTGRIEAPKPGSGGMTLRDVVAINRGDALFEAWLVARNAETLIRHPFQLFQTEHCAPVENTLTLSLPMIAMGVLAIPALLVTDDPILIYNFSIVALTLVMAFSMYWLVTDWSGVPAAGIVAGLLYAFHPLRLFYIVHPTEWDTSWTVLALLFARRLFARGWWRDAVGLVLAVAMQMASNFYQLMAAVFLVPPFALWLARHYRLRRVRLGQLAFVAAAVLLAAALIYGPYLEVRSSAPKFLHRSAFFYASLSGYLPHGSTFPGWPLVALAFLGMVLGRRRALVDLEGDPRWALLAGAILVAIMAAGSYNNEILLLFWEKPPFTLPDPYAFLAGVLPGLDAVRVVFRLSAGVILAFSVLAGLGAAALIRASGRHSPLVAAALIAGSAAAVLRPDLLGSTLPRGWDLHDVRASQETVQFFDALAKLGNDGPLLELPYDPEWGWGMNPERILLTAYHHRRTSACYGSFLPPENREILLLSMQLPEPAAARRLRELGFTTVVAHHGKDRTGSTLSRLLQGPGSQESLRLLQSNGSITAFELLPAGRGSPAPSAGR